ncbi:YidC/Oxa1 family membrane protein insertase [Heliophilum fasciatum]|uniref:Protein translocase subunit yidC n=1 Tax=Heliophilum fasciatum TaxID=35700 RepID=A0A4R2RL99_9FIRM|nr:YidC/Oxa1 family membrane protein insertase [Heliophilum fasciatum]MCW2278279.1 YidC/Oxa1 family membrane protein insertase [Heliophilum fasciatum]TCP63903.1 protein translocase subunit yidC [Heliophilum fasciatum]
MWDQFVGGFTKLIEWFYTLTVSMGVPSYALAIILITIVVKIALYPLTAKQMKSMRAMAELAPKQKALQERYKKDPQKQQEMMMELYKEHGINPLSGCLPLLLQFPILIAFYNALMHLQYTVPEHAGFIWLLNLSDPDPAHILPVLAGVTTYIQMKVSTTPSSGSNAQAEQTQKLMTYFMPFIIGYMAMNFAAGLALYWVTFNTAGIVQQLFINRSFKIQKGEKAAG